MALKINTTIEEEKNYLFNKNLNELKIEKNKFLNTQEDMNNYQKNMNHSKTEKIINNYNNLYLFSGRKNDIELKNYKINLETI